MCAGLRFAKNAPPRFSAFYGVFLLFVAGQEIDGFHVVLGSSQILCRVPVFVCRVNVRVVLQEKLANIPIPELCCDNKGSPAAIVLGVGIRAIIQQQLHDFGVSRFGGCMQRCPAVVPFCCVNSRAKRQQFFAYGFTPPSRRHMQGCPIVIVSGVHVYSAFDNFLNQTGVARINCVKQVFGCASKVVQHFIDDFHGTL